VEFGVAARPVGPPASAATTHGLVPPVTRPSFTASRPIPQALVTALRVDLAPRLAGRIEEMSRLPTLRLLISLPVLAGSLSSAGPKPSTVTCGLKSASDLKAVNARLHSVTCGGRRAIQLLPLPGHETNDEELLGIVSSSHFGDGRSKSKWPVPHGREPRPARVDSSASRSGRGAMGRGSSAFTFAPRMVVPCRGSGRNRSVQYMSIRELPWKRLRDESPGEGDRGALERLW
jgi:hypothetical protein